MVEPMAPIEACEDQLVAALGQWNEARRLARERSGETAAEERSEQLYNESYDAYARIASTRARTLFERNAGEASLYRVRLRCWSLHQKWERPSKRYSASRWTTRRSSARSERISRRGGTRPPGQLGGRFASHPSFARYYRFQELCNRIFNVFFFDVLSVHRLMPFCLVIEHDRKPSVRANYSQLQPR
jgi:hypothetical protein